jgi:hypothetical protein
MNSTVRKFDWNACGCFYGIEMMVNCICLICPFYRGSKGFISEV